MRKKNYIFNRVAIIGMGLIGSSLSCAIKRKKISRYVSATAASDKTIRVIRKLKLANKVSNTAKEAVQDADLIIICTPISVVTKPDIMNQQYFTPRGPSESNHYRRNL